MKLTRKYLRSFAGKAHLKALDRSILIWFRRSRGIKDLTGCPLCRAQDQVGKEYEDCNSCIINLDRAGKDCKYLPHHDWDDPTKCERMYKYLSGLKRRAFMIKWFNWR